MQPVLDWIAQAGEILVPILVALASVFTAAKWIGEIFANKKADKTNKAQLGLLEAIVNKDTCADAVDKNTEHIDALETKVNDNVEQTKNIESQLIILGEMLNTIFENSTISPEAKEHLKALKTKLEYGAQGEFLNGILDENTKLKEEVSVLQKQIQATAEAGKAVIATVNDEIRKTSKKYNIIG